MDRKSIGTTIFLVLTFSVNWLMAGVFYALGGRLMTIPGVIFSVAYMFVPAVAAVVVQRLWLREAVIRPLGVRFNINRWFLVAWVLPPVAAFAAFAISLLFPDVFYTPGMEGMFERYKDILPPDQTRLLREQFDTFPVHPIWLALVQGMIAGVTVNALAGFGEELGWRGFLQRQWASMGFWKSSLLTGFIWGIWHAPLILQGHNYPQHPILGIAFMTVFTMLLAPAMSYVRTRAGSVIAAAIMHGTLNGTAGLAIILIGGGDDLTTGITGVPGMIAWALVNLALIIHDRFFSRVPIMTASAGSSNRDSACFDGLSMERKREGGRE